MRGPWVSRRPSVTPQQLLGGQPARTLDAASIGEIVVGFCLVVTFHSVVDPIVDVTDLYLSSSSISTVEGGVQDICAPAIIRIVLRACGTSICVSVASNYCAEVSSSKLKVMDIVLESIVQYTIVSSSIPLFI